MKRKATSSTVALARCPNCAHAFDDRIGLYYLCVDGSHVCSSACKKAHDVKVKQAKEKADA